MAFSETELARIDRIVGELCQLRNRPEFHDELRLEYRVDKHDVVLVEVRERYAKLSGLSDTPVAKFKYVRTADEWRLLWMRRDLKWHAYDPFPASSSLRELVDEVNADSYCCFFG